MYLKQHKVYVTPVRDPPKESKIDLYIQTEIAEMWGTNVCSCYTCNTTGNLVERRFSVHESGWIKNMNRKLKSCGQVKHLKILSSTWKRHWTEYFEKQEK